MLELKKLKNKFGQFNLKFKFFGGLEVLEEVCINLLNNIERLEEMKNQYKVLGFDYNYDKIINDRRNFSFKFLSIR